MIRRPPMSQRPDPLFPYPTRYRSIAALLVGIGLAGGLDLNVVRTAAESISAFAIPAPPPPESPRPVERAPDSKAGKAAPPNERAKAVPAVAPKPKLPVPDPALPAAPHPGPGPDAAAGAAPSPGQIGRASCRDRVCQHG